MSEDADRNVLLVEAGPDYDATEKFPADLLDAELMTGAMPGHPNNWAFVANLTPELPYAVARGKILGGSTALNGTYYIRAKKVDFDEWVRLGNPEWSYEKTLPFYKQQERDLLYGRQREQAVADGSGGADGLPGQAQDAGPAQQVVGQAGDDRPGGVGGELARRKVRQGLIFEVADAELDDGVLAVLGHDDRQRLGAVGREREQLPGGQQLALAVERADAANDEAPIAELGFGDLGDARRG